MRLGIFRLLKLFLASLFLQSSWSFYSMQSLGFLFTAMAGIDDKKRESLIKNTRVFFNTHPYMAGFIIGAVLNSLEREIDEESLQRNIMATQSAFASFGDTLFWQTIRPVLTIIAVILGLKIGFIGPLVFIIIYNIIHIYFRFYGFIAGYQKGWDVIYVLKDKRMELLQKIFEIIGAFLVGLLPIILPKSFNVLFMIPLSGVFIILLWKKVAPILILTFVFILIIINLIFL